MHQTHSFPSNYSIILLKIIYNLFLFVCSVESTWSSELRVASLWSPWSIIKATLASIQLTAATVHTSEFILLSTHCDWVFISTLLENKVSPVDRPDPSEKQEIDCKKLEDPEENLWLWDQFALVSACSNHGSKSWKNNVYHKTYNCNSLADSWYFFHELPELVIGVINVDEVIL